MLFGSGHDCEAIYIYMFYGSRRYLHGGMAKIKEKYITNCLFVKPISAVTVCFAYII
jgi:hypothetical protein